MQLNFSFGNGLHFELIDLIGGSIDDASGLGNTLLQTDTNAVLLSFHAADLLEVVLHRLMAQIA